MIRLNTNADVRHQKHRHRHRHRRGVRLPTPEMSVSAIYMETDTGRTALRAKQRPISDRTAPSPRNLNDLPEIMSRELLLLLRTYTNSLITFAFRCRLPTADHLGNRLPCTHLDHDTTCPLPWHTTCPPPAAPSDPASHSHDDNK